jgi:hypothetical protein
MTCCQNRETLAWDFFKYTTLAEISKRYKSPVQGIWCNCTFTAALSSISWVHPKFNRDMSTLNPPFQYFFWDESNSTKIEVQIEPWVFVRNVGDTPPSFCGGKSSNSVTELWSSLYEKAYAKFCLYKKDPVKMSQNNLKDPAFWPLYNAAGQYDNWYNPCSLTCTEWGGNPVTVMVRLTGCSAITKRMYPIDGDGFPDRTQPVYDIFNSVNGFCQAAGGLNKTKCAMAAYTYIAEEGPISGTNQSKRYIPADCHYTDNGIRANHSYSILGVFVDDTNYIVLRDTSGIDPSDTGLLNKIYTGLKQWQYGNKFFPLSDTPVTKPIGLVEEFGTPMSPRVTLSSGDGIFALKASEFGNYFEGIGWLQPP